MKKVIAGGLVFFSLLFLNCPLPVDPDTNPSNAEATFLTINGTTPTEVINVAANENVPVGYELHLSKFIDSISFEILSSLQVVENRHVIKKPWDNDTQLTTIIFPATGTKTCVLATYKTNSTKSEVSLVFEVIDKPGNKRPVWSPDTVDVVSEKGKAATHNLKLYANDPDKNAVSLSVTLPVGAPFTWADSILTSGAALDVGNYSIQVIVSDGALTDTGTVAWRVYVPNEVHAQISDDTGETSAGKPVGIDVLVNDHITTGELVISSVTQGSNGTAAIRNNRVIYIPDEDFIGRDALKYIVNGKDTGRVSIVVKEATVTNQPPVWSPDTAKLSSEKGKPATCVLGDYASDPDADLLTFTVQLPQGVAFTFDNSAYSITTDGSPDTGVYVIPLTVSDGKATATGSIKWHIVLTITDTVVTFGKDSLTVPEGGGGIVNVLRNDAISAGNLSITAVVNGQKGTAAKSGDSSVTYTASGSSTGADTVSYVVNTGDTGRVFITITPTKFFLNDDSASVLQGGERIIRVLENDTISFGKLVINKAAGATLGSVDITDTSIIYKAKDDAAGKDSLVYFVNGNRDSASVRITVLPIEITTVNDTVTIDEDGAAVTIDALANDAITTGAMTVTDVTLGNLGTATVDADNNVIFTPSPDSNGVDTLEYLVNDAKAGLIIITITPKNDPPVFTAIDTVSTLNEKQNDTLVLKAKDADKIPVALSLGEAPEWATATTAADSIRIILAPGYGTVSATGNTPFIFFVRGVSGTDTIRQTVTITVNNVNTAPAFTNPLEQLTISEAASNTTSFSATDAQGDEVTISVPIKPAWVTVSGSGSTISLVSAPGYAVATTAASTKTDSVVLKASDGVDSVEHTFIINVTNVNRSPSFSAFPPATDSVPIGGSLTTAALAGSDPDGDAVTYRLVTSIAGMTLGSTDHIIRWDIPRTGYTVGQSVTVTARISDGKDSADRSFTLVIEPHKWILMNGSVAGEPTSPTYFAAVGKDTVFKGDKNVDGDYGIYIMRSIDGGSSFSTTPFLSYSVSNVDYQISYLNAKGTSVYAAGPNRHTSYYMVFPWNSNVPSETEMKLYRTFDVSPDGKRIISSQDTYWPASDPPPPVVSYIDATMSRLSDTLFDTLRSISCGNTYIWAIDGNTSAYYSSAYTVGGNMHGFTMHTFSSNFSRVYCDNNDGDSAYALVNSASEFYQLVAPATKSKITLASGVVPAGMAILSGSLGWFWTTAGKVYFSNDSFRTITEEVLKDGSSTVQIINMFKSSDGTTVFANTKATDGTIKLFRY